MRKQIIFILLFGILITACLPKQKDIAPTVTVSVMPQKFFVDKIAGNWLKVNVMVPAGASPATYEPTPMQMKSLSASKAYFKVGHLGFEKAWMNKLESLNPEMKVVDTSKDMELIEEEEYHHDHGHKHEGYNPHIWLSPKLVKQQAQTIYSTLCELYPEQKEPMSQNLAVFFNQIDSTSAVLNSRLIKAKGIPFIVYHPVWNYLAHDYGLNQIAIEHNGKEASVNKMKAIIDLAKENDIHIIFAQKEFNGAQAQSIANEINGSVVFLNPLDYNWFHIMSEFGNAFSSIAGE